MADRTELIPLGGSVQRTDVTTPTEQIENFVPVVVAPTIGGQKQLRMVKRRGYQNQMVAAAAGYAINTGLQWSGTLGSGSTPPTYRGVIVYAAAKANTDLKLYQWNSSETTLGTYATANYSAIDIQETLISGVANLTINIGKIVSPYDQKYLYFPAGGALTELVGGNFPATTIGRGVHMDGYYFLASTDGYIYNLDLNSVAAIASTNQRIAVQMQPDSLVGLAKIRNIIWALGTQSLEPFQNAGNASGSPLNRIAQGALKIGCVNGAAVQEINEGLLFISNGPEGVGVHMLEGFTARKVSTPAIDQILQTNMLSAFTAPLPGGLYRLPGLTGIVKQHGLTGVQMSVAGGPYVYWPSVDVWTHLTLGSGASTDARVFAASPVQLTTDANGAMLWHTDASTLASSGQDYNATNFPAYIQTTTITRGTDRRKVCKRLRITGDQQTVSTPVIVSYSDDNGANFTTLGTIDMSIAAQMQTGLHRAGSYYKRIWKFSNTSAGGCAIDAIWETFEVGSA